MSLPLYTSITNVFSPAYPSHILIAFAVSSLTRTRTRRFVAWITFISLAGQIKECLGTYPYYSDSSKRSTSHVMINLHLYWFIAGIIRNIYN